MSALRSATITQAMICKIKTGMNGLKWRVLLQLRRIEGHSKAQSKLHFGIFFPFNCNISSENRYYMDQNL